MSGKKSETCFNKKNGNPLMALNSQIDAQMGADYANVKYHRYLVPYLCEKCSCWHLSPKERQTPSTVCQYCTDRNGYSKDRYETYVSAKNRAKIIFNEQHIELTVYECPYALGWHLTKG